jgi:4-deoxy-L-threo-5-hexosulose-uronate ketol-isomerase
VDIREATSPAALAGASTEELRRRYLVQSLFEPGGLRLVYSQHDRLILGGAVPAGRPIRLEPGGPVRGAQFLEHREAGILHVGGGPGLVRVDAEEHELGPRDMLYVGRGSRTVELASASESDPARLYLVSAVAHAAFPDAQIREDDVTPVQLGSPDAASGRALRQYIFPDRCRSAALVMGVTTLDPGAVWNTMPAHVHDRRTEVYLYFDLPEDARVVHLMGPPDQTRSLIVADGEAVISPPWSIHSGAGTAAYRFCWAMAGENVDYTDMDPVPMSGLV